MLIRCKVAQTTAATTEEIVKNGSRTSGIASSNLNHSQRPVATLRSNGLKTLEERHPPETPRRRQRKMP